MQREPGGDSVVSCPLPWVWDALVLGGQEAMRNACAGLRVENSSCCPEQQLPRNLKYAVRTGLFAVGNSVGARAGIVPVSSLLSSTLLSSGFKAIILPKRSSGVSNRSTPWKTQ